jgi:D-methionine transport system ATP-binding protein
MKPFIEISNLRKSYKSNGRHIEVLKGINLSVEKGDIYGIVGFSGAGKSTLVRCINRLEEPDSGHIIIGGKDIMSLSKKELALERRKIGMIFQGFNLFDSMTVAQNIEYPLRLERVSRKARKERVDELLELIGLKDKGNVYPGALSGGQKQRVGIGRAIANDPDVLLSDEATSALDPQTTLSVLKLLKDINARLGITILLITHELEAIKYTCRNMAVLESGIITESGPVYEIFQKAESATGKIFIEVYGELQRIEWNEGGGI